MKIIEIIDSVDALKPNTYTPEEKVKWLSKLDESIHNEIVMTHEHTEEEAVFVPYDEQTDKETELLVKSPYDYDLYTAYLESKIDYYNGEMARYNNSVSMFNNAYSTYAKFYNRGRTPLTEKLNFF